MIFLGAGASKPYGIPTLEEFSKDAIDELKKLGHGEILEEIRKSLVDFNLTLDFESLYSILEKLADPYKSVQLSGPFTAFILKNKENLPLKYDYSELLRDLRNIIYNKCSINEDSFIEVQRCMGKLLEVTHKSSSEEIMLGKSRWNGSINRVFVTTNYDMALELYFESQGIKINDGYREEGFPIKQFDPTILLDPYVDADKSIIKLHGSIWQFLQDGKMIKTKVDPDNSSRPYKINVDQEMMIYPTRQKDILNYQFFPFFQAFKNISWTKLLVIGYSFRDEPVNSAIIENMMLNESQLIVINPNCDDVLGNLYSNLPDTLQWKIPDYRLFKFDGYFGEEEVFEYLKSIERMSWDQR